MHRALVVIGLVLALFPGRSLAQTSAPPDRAQLIAMLSGFEDAPTLAHIRSWGDDAVPILVSIHDDPGVLAPVRLRAVEAVGAFSTPLARAFLLRVLHDEAEPTVVVREAIEALASAAGPDAVAPLCPYLTHEDRGIRERVIEALGAIGTVAARHALAGHVARERDAALASRAEMLAVAPEPPHTTH